MLQFPLQFDNLWLLESIVVLHEKAGILQNLYLHEE